VTGAEFSIAAEEINGGAAIEATLLFNLNLGKSLIEQRRPWMILRKTDPSRPYRFYARPVLLVCARRSCSDASFTTRADFLNKMLVTYSASVLVISPFFLAAVIERGSTLFSIFSAFSFMASSVTLTTV
jgi:hypothetical protein